MVAFHNRRLAKISATRNRQTRRASFGHELARPAMIDVLLRDLRQPEYIHVLINPLPVYGLATGLIGLLAALLLRSRPAEIATLILVLITAASAWPVYEFGEQAYDRVDRKSTRLNSR